MHIEIATTSADETQAFGARLGALIKGGLTIELASDLGGGKTTLVQGLARGLGYHGEVTSPTFTLSRVYKLADGRELHHYDLYRLGQAGAVGDELEEDLADPSYVTVIEWADILESNLPADRLKIVFGITTENARELDITAGGPRSTQVVEQLK